MTDTVELTRNFTPPATAPLLSVRNIEVVYDKVILVLRGLSLDVPKGAIVALLGANGAGKSTTLKAISGLLKTEEGEVTRGEILFDGERINGIDPDHIVRRGIFQVMEGRRIIADMTTLENLRLGAFTRSDPSFATPNLEYHVQPLSLDRFNEPLHPFPAFTASVCNLRPTSRGEVRPTSPAPGAVPAIRPNYLSTDEDKRVAADSIRLTRRIAAAPALARFAPSEYRPGPELAQEHELVRAAGSPVIAETPGPAERHKADFEWLRSRL